MRNVVNDDGGRPVHAAAAEAEVDLAFLDAQTFGDRDLEREVLGLFVEQARRVVPSLPDLPVASQADAAHLLKGSARGIGAWAAAAIAQAYEISPLDGRPAIHAELTAVFARTERSIESRLAALGG